VVIAAWPAFSAAVLSAAASLGYVVTTDLNTTETETAAGPRKVSLEVPQSEIVTAQLGRDQRITVARDGVTVTFSRDERGRASICVTGSGQSDEALRTIGEELSRRVVQHYVYQRLMDEIRARQFVVVEEERDESHAIRLKVRHWE
jgi:hypothetical protein